MLSEGRILQQLSVVVRTMPTSTAVMLDVEGVVENGDMDDDDQQTLLEKFIQTLVQLLIEVPVL